MEPDIMGSSPFMARGLKDILRDDLESELLLLNKSERKAILVGFCVGTAKVVLEEEEEVAELELAEDEEDEFFDDDDDEADLEISLWESLGASGNSDLVSALDSEFVCNNETLIFPSERDLLRAYFLPML